MLPCMDCAGVDGCLSFYAKSTCKVIIRPPLSKKSFPVCRVGKKSQSGGRESFFPPDFIFL